SFCFFLFFFFFFQAEDGIRDRNVTGVQTCALPISLLDDHLGVALLALDAGRHRPDRVAVGVHVQGVAALRVAGAGQERPAAAFTDDHRAVALLALVLRRPRRDDRLALGVEVHGRLAFGVAGAAEERP